MQQKDGESSRCLVCGTSPIQSRGLCAKHHSQFHREMRGLTPEQKIVYEKTLIERQLLAPRKPPGRQVTKDPFKEIAQELFVAESEQDFDMTGKKKKKTARKTSGRKKKTRKKKKG